MAIDLLDQILPHIKDAIYTSRISLLDWKMKETDAQHSSLPPLDDKGWALIRIPFQWTKTSKKVWFRQTIQIPESFQGKPVALLTDSQEGAAYVNGQFRFGFDSHNRETFLSEKAKNQQKFVVTLQIPNAKNSDSNQFNIADLVVVDNVASRLYHSLKALHELENLLEHNSSESKEVHELIRRTLIYLKYFRPGSEEYPNAIRRASAFLESTIDSECKPTIRAMVHVVAYSSIDAAPLVHVSDNLETLGKTLSTVLEIMELHPDVHYAQGQALVYERTKQYFPEFYRQIKRLVASQRWEINGCTFVRPDCRVTNSESLIRHILYGKKFFQNEFGFAPDMFWFSDFYHCSPALPQILRSSGNIFLGITTINDAEKSPAPSLFNWEGIDGSKILTLTSTLRPNSSFTPESILSQLPEISSDPESTTQVLQFLGATNISHEQIDSARALRSIAGLPAVQLSSLRNFLSSVSIQNLPTRKESQGISSPSGIHPQPSWLKKENRECEIFLAQTEVLSVLSMLFAGKASLRKYPAESIQALWKTLLLNQADQIMAGTVPLRVYHSVRNDFSAIRKQSGEIIKRSLDALSVPAPKSKTDLIFSVFNTTQWSRNEYVELNFKSKQKYFEIFDSSNNPIESQVLSVSKGRISLLCYVSNIPAFSSSTLTVRPVTKRTPEPIRWKVSPYSIETPLYKIRFDKKGGISSLFAKQLRREIIQKGKRANTFSVVREPLKHIPAPDPAFVLQEQPSELWNFKNIKFVELGPLRATIHLEYRSEHHSMLSQEVRVYHKSPRIDFVTNIKLHEKQIALQASFPLNIATGDLTVETQGGVLQYPMKGFEKDEISAQQWADISDSKFGISLLNDCKYGYSLKDSTLSLSLLRSTHFPKHHEEQGDPEFVDLGSHSFTYSLYPHIGSWKTARIISQARMLNTTLFTIADRVYSVPASLLQIEKPNIIVDAVKKAEDSDAIVIRLHEGYGETTDTGLVFGADVKNAAECDLLENVLKVHKTAKPKLSLRFKPFEIKTLKIEKKPGKK
jgi:alpha-mannosidase